MAFGRRRGPSLETNTLLPWPITSIVAHCGLEVCDGAHRWFVMKKVKTLPQRRHSEPGQPHMCDLLGSVPQLGRENRNILLGGKAGVPGHTLRGGNAVRK